MPKTPEEWADTPISIDKAESVRRVHPGAEVEAVLPDVKELWWAWVVPYYADPPPPEEWLIGVGPYLVDKYDGQVIPTGSAEGVQEIERMKGYRGPLDHSGVDQLWELF